MTGEPRPISHAVRVTFSEHDFGVLQRPRELTEWERGMLTASAEMGAERSAPIQAQSRTVRVIEECADCPSVIIRPAGTSPRIRSARTRATRFGVLGSGLHARDVDGVPILAHVHVRDGYLAEIEVVRADGTSIEELPAIDKFEPLPEGEFEVPPPD